MLKAIELAKRTCDAVRKFEEAVKREYPAGATVRFRYRNRDGDVCIGAGIVSKHQYPTADMAEDGLRVVLSPELFEETGRTDRQLPGSLDPPGNAINVNWSAVV